MHEKLMRQALKEAFKAYEKDEVPVGCVAVKDGKIIARGHNLRESTDDPTSHAEIICVKKAARKTGDWRLNDITLYCTLEPCSMCSGAIIHARIKQVVFGASDPKFGMSRWLKRQKIKTKKGVLEKECREILQRFFREKRKS
ncbi:MAG: nucleoside deaminase [Candidatus Margulisiibacteriota bacterium]